MTPLRNGRLKKKNRIFDKLTNLYSENVIQRKFNFLFYNLFINHRNKFEPILL